MRACALGTAHGRPVRAHGLNALRALLLGPLAAEAAGPSFLSYTAGAQPRARMPFARKPGEGCQAPRTGLLWSCCLARGLPGPSHTVLAPSGLALTAGALGGGHPGLGGAVGRADLARSLVGTSAQPSHQGPRLQDRGGPCTVAVTVPGHTSSPGRHSVAIGGGATSSQLFQRAQHPGQRPPQRLSEGPGSRLGGFQRHLVSHRGRGAAASHVAPSTAPHVPGLALRSQKPG